MTILYFNVWTQISLKQFLFLFFQRNRIKEAAQRFNYALKKFPKDGFGDDARTFRDLRVNLLLSLSKCKRKLQVSWIFGDISMQSENQVEKHKQCAEIRMYIFFVLECSIYIFYILLVQKKEIIIYNFILHFFCLKTKSFLLCFLKINVFSENIRCLILLINSYIM